MRASGAHVWALPFVCFTAGLGWPAAYNSPRVPQVLDNLMTRSEVDSTETACESSGTVQPSTDAGHGQFLAKYNSYVGTLKSLWLTPPAQTEYLDAIAVGVARLFLLVMSAGYLWAWGTNSFYGTLSNLWVFSALMLVVIFCASPRVAMPSKIRLSLMCFVMVVVAESSVFVNANPWAAMIAISPIATLVIFAFGGRIAALVVVALHVLFLVQSLLIGSISVEEALRIGFVASIWSLMLAGFVTLLLNLIDSKAERINDLLRKERKTYDTLTEELREPTVLLSQFIQTLDADTDQRETLTGIENVLLGVVDHLDSSRTVEPLARPPQMLPFSLEVLTRQLNTQMEANLERWGMELFTDVASPADQVVLGDQFRVRTILANLIRSISLLSNGTRIWLSVQGQNDPKHQLACVFVVESNGQAINAAEIEQILNDEVMDNVDSGFARSGLQLAKSWTHQLAGEFKHFSSPRGGNGFRVLLNFQLEAPESLRDSP